MAKAARLSLAIDQNWVMASEQLLAAIRGGTVDMFCITVQEYRQITPYVDTTRILGDIHGGDELVLVVRQADGVSRLADLRHKSLVMLDSPNTSLADDWLAVSFWHEGLDSPDKILGKITKTTKLSQAVLPLFFGQADACLVPRRGLTTMFEMNPQLSQKLKILLTSPKAQGAFFAWRQDYPAQFKVGVFDRLTDLRSSPAATQVLTLFQASGFITADMAPIRPALSIIEAYEQHEHPPGRKK
ncbi:MAG: PhnD/SsuA/transferrin family substrate-binding protein [Bryobacteraceae bacterium]